MAAFSGFDGYCNPCICGDNGCGAAEELYEFDGDFCSKSIGKNSESIGKNSEFIGKINELLDKVSKYDVSSCWKFPMDTIKEKIIDGKPFYEIIANLWLSKEYLSRKIDDCEEYALIANEIDDLIAFFRNYLNNNNWKS